MYFVRFYDGEKGKPGVLKTPDGAVCLFKEPDADRVSKDLCTVRNLIAYKVKFNQKR